MLSEPAVARALETERLLFREVVYPDGYDMPAHEHDIDCFVLILEGTLRGRVGTDAFDARSASLLFMPAWRPHENVSYGSARTFDVVLTSAASEEYGDFLPRGAKPVVSHATIAATLAARMHRELEQPDRATSLILTGLTAELLGRLSRASLDAPRRPRWLPAVLDFLHAHDHASLDDVAAAARVHPAHLTRAFRTHVGRTVGEYSRRLRLERACTALRRSDLSLAEVAMEAGFADQSHFSRAFKAHTGMTPGQYRAQFSCKAMQLRG
ncbi:MAG TPA: AraC family transcriptional regulator [Thermoanaerobaculia bacterium]|nr:AraC family transcriptional regulator [Thermoanaerobaculia bacterium]